LRKPLCGFLRFWLGLREMVEPAAAAHDTKSNEGCRLVRWSVRWQVGAQGRWHDLWPMLAAFYYVADSTNLRREKALAARPCRRQGRRSGPKAPHPRGQKTNGNRLSVVLGKGLKADSGRPDFASKLVLDCRRQSFGSGRALPKQRQDATTGSLQLEFVLLDARPLAKVIQRGGQYGELRGVNNTGERHGAFLPMVFGAKA
jgi:hypothetical protein